MCGIIGYVGPRECKQLLLHGLERLEYRGYDSAGIALLEAGGLEYTRAVGNLQNLKELAGVNGSPATTGLGHTRWATHGGVTEANAHPLAAEDEAKLAIVLNGIVENYRELRERLSEQGHVFSSETDAETVTHLIEDYYEGDLVEAVRLAYAELEGHFAFVVIHRDHPGMLVGARLQCPMVVGLAEGEALGLAPSRNGPLPQPKPWPRPKPPNQPRPTERNSSVVILPSSMRLVSCRSGLSAGSWLSSCCADAAR